MPTLNPFWHGTPVPSEKFIGREHELRQIVGRILTGQSTAITGSPRCGKTSILDYLMAPVKRQELYEEHAEQLIFSYLDAYNWGTEFGPIQFWETALRPLSELTETALSQAYKNCQEDRFGDYALEKLINKIKAIDKQLVLMVDGFDVILGPKHLSQHWNAAFFGNLRTLASRSGGALALLITVNGPLSEFQKGVQELTRSNAPYFNFIYEVRLGAFSNEVVKQLLRQGGERFSDTSYELIRELTGGHPYLLQVAASILWEMGDKSKSPVPFIEDFYPQVQEVLDEIWQSWSKSLQKAFVSVAFVQMKELKEVFKKRLQIDMEKLIRRIPPLKLDLEYLKQYGFVTEDENMPGGWRVVPRIFLPFAILNFKEEYRNKLPKEVFNYLFVSGYGEKSKFPFFKFS
jgi:Cdc6-like AAA superfamily ATPase